MVNAILKWPWSTLAKIILVKISRKQYWQKSPENYPRWHWPKITLVEVNQKLCMPTSATKFLDRRWSKIDWSRSIKNNPDQGWPKIVSPSIKNNPNQCWRKTITTEVVQKLFYSLKKDLTQLVLSYKLIFLNQLTYFISNRIWKEIQCGVSQKLGDQHINWRP